MEHTQFQIKLRREILSYSVVLIGFITILLGFFFFKFNRFVVNFQISETETIVTELVKQTMTAYSEELIRHSDTLYADFLKAEASESNIYSNLYTINANQEIKGELILFDSDLEIIFVSNNRWVEDPSFKYYMSLIATAERNQEPVIKRVYRDRNKDHNLLLVTTVGNGEGYAAYVINGKDIRSRLNQLPAQFVVYDKFDNVLTSSTDQFMMGTLNKISTALFQDKFTYQEDTYYSHREELSPELSLLVFKKGTINPTLIRFGISIVAILVFIFTVFSFWFSKRVSTNNARSVGLLSNEMNLIKENPNHLISLETQDEFEIISSEINKMLMELSGAHDKNIRLLKENLQAEKKMLEAQFNPHFLYNTLEIIRATISFDPQLANQLILSLTKILRYSLEEKNTEATLETDLVYLEEYLTISKARFEAFNYHLQIEEKVINLAVPKLFLLPLIENSLKYGFQYKQDLTLRVSGTLDEEGQIVLTVMDTGGALDEKRAEALDIALQQDTQIGSHHGLMNSKRRIQLMYPEAEFHISVKGDKTLVTIRIGARKNV